MLIRLRTIFVAFLALVSIALQPTCLGQQLSSIDPASQIYAITSLPKLVFVEPVARLSIAMPVQPAPATLVASAPETVPPAASSPEPTQQSNGSAPVTPNLGAPPLRASVSEPQALPVSGQSSAQPFRTYAVQVKAGVAGIGVDLATPLAKRFNVRVGGSFFSLNNNFNIDGMTINSDLKLRSTAVSLDWFPFNGGFRVSPILTVYNGNSMNATVSVPAGNQFSLGDGDYTSSATDPIHGLASLSFGKKVAPGVTFGWGNMIPRSGKHLSFPFEVGFQYINDPLFSLNLAGTACNNQGCDNIATDSEAQANLQQERNDINSDIHPLRFYPIFSLGVAWKF